MKLPSIRAASPQLAILACAAVLAGLAVPAAAAAPARASSAPACASEQIPVTLSAPAHLAGTLCQPAGGSKVVQVLIPGATYTRSYWMWPGRSYAAAANAAGYATFALDRLDTGQSSQINPALVTITTDAESVHQAIGWLKARFGFTRVVLVGHSVGSAVAVQENDMYPHDATALVLSGYSTWFAPPLLEAMAAGAVIPAQLSGDPALESRPLGELTAQNWARTELFYAPGDSSEAIIAADNASKDTVTAGELAGIITGTGILGLADHGVTAPVLLAVGSKDGLFDCGPATPCGSASQLVSAERPYFPHAPVVDGYVLPGSGHDLNLADNAPLWFTAAQNWITAHAGR